MSGLSEKQSPILVLDSITQVPTDADEPPVVVCGSHGGLAAAVFAVQKQVKAAIFNNAGIGKDRAGIAGFDLLDQYGILAACVDAFSARIGVGAETMAGKISHANRLAHDAGVRPGQEASKAADIMAQAPWHPLETDKLEAPEEKETIIQRLADGRYIVTLDSNSMIRPEHQTAVVLTGSHGGLVGDLPAVKHPVLAAFYNDAGVGKDKAGISRLSWLQDHGIIGATVAADSARIGVGLDTYESGIVSFVNDLGQAVGIVKGMKAVEAVSLILKSQPQE